jgi:hypothetical protein
MALPEPMEWPDGIEWRPRREPFDHKPYDEPQKTPMEGGNTRRRARPADEVIRQTVLWKFTPAEYDGTMEAFFADARARGWAGNYVLPGGTTKTGVINIDGVPQVRRKRLVEVTATLEILPDDGA